MPLIEIPKDKGEDYMWMARLDAWSLKSWHLPTIDILVQVPPDSSSVLHLLKSIREADYSGLALPRITLELPYELDMTVERILRSSSGRRTRHVLWRAASSCCVGALRTIEPARKTLQYDSSSSLP